MCRVHCRTLFTLALLFLSASLCIAEQVTPSTVSLRHSAHSWLVVPVRINGNGPYDFLLDTGSSITILDARLFRDLGLRADGESHLSSLATEGEQFHRRAVAAKIEVSDVAVTNVAVTEVATLDVKGLDLHVRGVLGENFLDHFDLLIDNDRGQVMFDAGDALVQEFDGKHLSLTTSSQFEQETILHRLMVAVTVPSYDKQPMRMVLDSGANALIILAHVGRGRHLLPGEVDELSRVSTVFQSMQCATWKDDAKWEDVPVRNIDMVTCENLTAAKADSDGSLPTRFFKRVLISHSHSYAIANPVRRRALKIENTAGLFAFR